jgi:hypothetical protein
MLVMRRKTFKLEYLGKFEFKFGSESGDQMGPFEKKCTFKISIDSYKFLPPLDIDGSSLDVLSIE